MNEAEQQEAARKRRIGNALHAIDTALNHVGRLGLDAAAWDLRNAKRRVEEAREKAHG